MNKAQLIDAVADRIGSRTEAAVAVESVLDAVVRSVARGEAVSVTGFGTLLPKALPGRTARNPRTGGEMTVAPTRVVRFRPGTRFQDLVSGRRQMPESGNCIQKDPKTPVSSAVRP
ncbi:HU family DNA-binding protein [Streptomyces cyaneofuscatus]|uniref:HU family DNA-binding protein n=1 Tax=Streptomyces cyaneofuscatus TaxID=66883 RepID=UPI0033DEFAA8